LTAPSPHPPATLFVTVTKLGEVRRCRWCGRRVEPRPGPGRPADYCRPSHRQRDYEARQRACELGLSESDLVVARQAIDHLHDQIYILECAIEDVEKDLADDDGPDGLKRALDWLLEAARPLLSARLLGEESGGGDDGPTTD
jgi:hypothetical protein